MLLFLFEFYYFIADVFFCCLSEQNLTLLGVCTGKRKNNYLNQIENYFVHGRGHNQTFKEFLIICFVIF